MTITPLMFACWLAVALAVGWIGGVWAMYLRTIPIIEEHEKECGTRTKATSSTA